MVSQARARSEALWDGRQAVLADHITEGHENIRDREGGEPRSKGPTQGKERPGITFHRKERWEGLRACKPSKRNAGGFAEQDSKSYAPSGEAPLLGSPQAKACGDWRTGCLNRARPGLWGERRATAAPARKSRALRRGA